MAESRITPAERVVFSWLRASGIPHCRGVDGYDIVAEHASGELVGINVCRPGPVAVEVSEDLASTRSSFAGAVAALGRPGCMPVDRGPLPGAPTSDPELSMLRHRDMHRSPNPQRGELEQHRRALLAVSRQFVRLNAPICWDAGLTEDDVLQYALVYATIYMGSMRRPELPEIDNTKIMITYVKQRLWELKRGLQRRMPVRRVREPATEEHRYDREQHDPMDTGRRVRVAIGRRQDVVEDHAEDLRECLATMKHRDMVSVLLDVATDADLRPDVRHLAAEKLQEHSGNCPECRSTYLQTANRLAELTLGARRKRSKTSSKDISPRSL